jgi:hypothetical protein
MSDDHGWNDLPDHVAGHDAADDHGLAHDPGHPPVHDDHLHDPHAYEPHAYDPHPGDPHPHEFTGGHGGAHYWHDLEHDHGSGISAQQSVLAGRAGATHAVADLTAVAQEHGWYTPGGGTPLYETGSLLEYYGVPVESIQDARLEDLEIALAEGLDVIVAVSPPDITLTDLTLDLDDYPGVPGQEPSHAVQLIGVDRSDPAHPEVLLAGPGPEAAGQSVPLPDFIDAWAPSGNFAVLAGGQRGA